MNLILATALEVRLVALFVLGTFAGSLANLGIYRLAWHARPISPWARADHRLPPRRWSDRIPVVGWLGLRREAGLHGTGFWIRPMLLELLTGMGLAALYWWEIGQLGLLPANALRPAAPGLLAVLHTQYCAHVALICLMIVASMIDLDEKIIPDTITVPGTLLGLLLAAALPWSLPYGQAPPLIGLMPAGFWNTLTPDTWPFLRLTSPNAWPGWLDGFPRAWSLVLGLGCWWLWCVALMPRSWYARHGWRRAVRLCVARLAREPATRRMLVMGLVGTAGIVGVWLLGRAPWAAASWAALLSALVGVAVGGGLVWAVRIIGTAALRREAMGFGDVTLLAMIGAFLGWQTCLVIFFTAPFAALLVGVLQLILLRDHEIPYGPYLCMATVAAIVCWAGVWQRMYPALAIGWMVPLVMLLCMVLMGLMLGFWQLVRGLLR